PPSFAYISHRQPEHTMANIGPLKRDLEKQRVILFTQHFKIVGDLHLPPGGRLTDFLNRFVGETDRAPFVAVTNAQCWSLRDNVLVLRTEYLAIHKREIGIAIPFSQAVELTG
ncbi:MAG: hypothetical protein AABY65_08640, partial [Nitrospirota bacterium]